MTLSDSLPRKRAKKSVGGFQGLPGSCPSFLQLAELAEAFAHLKFQAHIDVRRRSQSTPPLLSRRSEDYSFLEMASFQAIGSWRHAADGSSSSGGGAAEGRPRRSNTAHGLEKTGPALRVRRPLFASPIFLVQGQLWRCCAGPVHA